MSAAIATVFGGTGFLGGVVAAHLAQHRWRVRVAVRSPAAGAAERSAHIEHVQADVRDDAAVERALDGASAAVNAVGLYVEQGEATFAAVHVAGAERVARAAAARDARLVHISGIGVDTSSTSAYVRTRALGELKVREQAPQAVILRPSVLFGPGDAFVSSLAQITRLLPVIPLFGRGDTRLQPVYVEDVAAAVVQALDNAASAGTTYELGGARSYRYRELLALLQHHMGRRRVLLPLPFAAWELAAVMLSYVPNAPLTRDQVALMRKDNIPDPRLPGFAELGLEPRALEDLLELCLTPAAG